MKVGFFRFMGLGFFIACILQDFNVINIDSIKGLFEVVVIVAASCTFLEYLKSF